MSYQLLSKTTAKARKDRPCIWCREPISAGSEYVREVGKFYGDFQSNCYHPECLDASQQDFRENPQSDGEFEPHAHKRGSLEER